MSETIKSQIISKINFKEISFDEETHKYVVGGVQLPSVTQIMKKLTENYYTDISPAVLKKAAERGTQVHQMLEMYETFGAVFGENLDHLLQYQRLKKVYRFVPIIQEVPLTNGIYCGTVDMLATLDDQLILVDVKATSKINDILLEVQLAGYLQLLNDNGIEVKNAYVLHLTKNAGKFKKINPNFMLWNELLNEVTR